MPSRVVVFDSEGRGCPTCSSLAGWSRSALSGLDVAVDRRSHWRGEKLDGATIVLRCTDCRILEGISGQARGLLALICATQPNHPALMQSLPPGVDDFLCCPCQEPEFATRLRRLVLRRNSPLRLSKFVGESPLFLEALDRIGPVARSAASVLLQGETGAGKELFARAIHYNSERASRPFVPLNCSALPEHLFENELFGHTKGAFTDARTGQRGLLGEAEGGTLFLDEVDMLVPSSQAKLLRFLQDREYRPLGSAKTLVADVRVVAATNADLKALVRAREFREDLYHRLNVLTLSIPPLRDRPSDIPLLARHFATLFAAQYNKGEVQFSTAASAKMAAYVWPGNVRELECVVHRAIVFTTSSTLEAESIEISGPTQEAAFSSRKDVAMLGFERTYLVNLLAQHQGNISHSADASGKDRRTLQRLMRKHGIRRVAFTA